MKILISMKKHVSIGKKEEDRSVDGSMLVLGEKDKDGDLLGEEAKGR